MSPKSLLRHASVKSPLDDFDDIGKTHSEISFFIFTYFINFFPLNFKN